MQIVSVRKMKTLIRLCVAKAAFGVVWGSLWWFGVIRWTADFESSLNAHD